MRETNAASTAGGCGQDMTSKSLEHSGLTEPLRALVLRMVAAVVEAVAGNAEEDHGEHPGEQRREERERGGECHEDGADAVVRGAAEAKEEGEAREAGTDRDEDEGVGKRVQRSAVCPGDAVAEVRAARQGRAEDTPVGRACALPGDIHEGDLVPGRGRDGCKDEEHHRGEGEEELKAEGKSSGTTWKGRGWHTAGRAAPAAIVVD